MPTHLPPPTVVPRDPVITAEATLKVRLWRAPRRESIPFCRGDWSIARKPSTLFIPHQHLPSPVIPVPRHGNPSPGRTTRAVPAEGPTSLCVIPRPREGSRTCPYHLPPPTVVPRAPVITAEARPKVRLWRAPRRESIPFCRGDWSIARTPSTLFIPHPPSPPRHSQEGPLVPCPPKAPPPFVSSRGPARDLGLAHSPASSNRRAPCPSHYCGG